MRRPAWHNHNIEMSVDMSVLPQKVTASKCRETKTRPTQYSRARSQSVFHPWKTHNGKSSLSETSSIVCDSFRPRIAPTSYQRPSLAPHKQSTFRRVKT